MTNNIKKIALFVSSGLGNAVMLVPLLKKLKEDIKNRVTIFLDSPFVSRNFLIHNEFPFDEIIEITKINKTIIIFANIQSFDIIYLDYSSSSLKNVLISRLISKKIIAFRENIIPFLNITYREEEKNTHACVLNLQLFDKEFNESDFDIAELKLIINDAEKPEIINNIELRGKIPVVIQTSSANRNAPYKNWSVNSWIFLLNKISENFPDLYFILMGDENEITISNRITNELQGSFIDITGKTDLIEMCNILYFAKLYIGLDSGVMHLAAAYDIPTFSIFGASSYNYFGYEKFKDIHKVIYNPINCWPCLGYKYTNRSKVKSPKDCPDIICLNNKKPDEVTSSFIRFYHALR